MSLAKDTLKVLLGSTVSAVHEEQKAVEKDLDFTSKVKLRLAKKTNWIAMISLGFAIFEKNPVDIISNAQILISWVF